MSVTVPGPEHGRPPHDRIDQLEGRVAGTPGERLHVGFDGVGTGTGTVGVSDERVDVRTARSSGRCRRSP